MKKPVLILIAMACMPAFTAGQVGAPAQVTPAQVVPAQVAAGQVVEEIISRVNSQIITTSEFLREKDQLRDEVKQQDSANADQLYAEREKDVLRGLIDQQLLLEKGKDLSITGDTDLIKRLDQMRKDMKLMLHESQELGVPMPVSEAAYAMLTAAMQQGLGDLDVAAIVPFMQRMAGMGEDSWPVPDGRTMREGQQ